MLSMTPKNKLREALQFAITALKADLFRYDWSSQSSCNCGIVIAAIIDGSSRDSSRVYHEAVKQAKDKGDLPSIESCLGYTWRELAQRSCTVTGTPLTEVFQNFEKMGFTIKDVVHLEYMTNAAILKESGINPKEKDYYKNKENLILYLEAWHRILESTISRESYSRKENLEADLLIAIATEKYEDAARIKKELFTA